MFQRLARFLRPALFDVDYDGLFSAYAVAESDRTAEAGALTDYQSVLGKRLKVTWIYVYYGISEEGEFIPPKGRHFVVKVIPTSQSDILHGDGRYFIDPYWNVEILEGEDLLPAGARNGWICGRTWTCRTSH